MNDVAADPVFIICLDENERKRFLRHIVSRDVTCIYYNEPRTWTSLLAAVREPATVFLVGARPPDKVAAALMRAAGQRIAILQHAINPRRHFGEVGYGYFISNWQKVVLWSMFWILCKALRLVRGGRTSTAEVKVLYFNSHYRHEWASALRGRVTFIECGPPNPLSFGSVNDVLTSVEPVDALLIDEPFQATLGISAAQERNLLRSVVGRVGGIVHVKAHPRGATQRYSFDPRFTLTDILHLRPRLLIGYRSGLLQAPFECQSFLRISTDGGGNFHLVPEARAPTIRQQTYIEDVRRELWPWQ